jgi:hypothetical protein
MDQPSVRRDMMWAKNMPFLLLNEMWRLPKCPWCELSDDHAASERLRRMQDQMKRQQVAWEVVVKWKYEGMHALFNLHFSFVTFQIHSESLSSYSLCLTEINQRLELSALVISVPSISSPVAYTGGHRNIVGLYIIIATCTLSQLHTFLAHSSGHRNILARYIIIATCTLSQLHTFLAHSSGLRNILARYITIATCTLSQLHTFLAHTSGHRNILARYIIIATCTLTVSYTLFSRLPVVSVTY